MCNQKLPFCPLVCLYGFFFSYIHINIFFSILLPTTHTKQLLTSDPDVFLILIFSPFTANIRTIARFYQVFPFFFCLNFYIIIITFLVKLKKDKKKDIYINEYI
jgi:hypothetical protein